MRRERRLNRNFDHPEFEEKLKEEHPQSGDEREKDPDWDPDLVVKRIKGKGGFKSGKRRLTGKKKKEWPTDPYFLTEDYPVS